MLPFNITIGPGPLAAAAIHDGHVADPETARHFALDEAERLREEDPFTAELAEVLPTRFVGGRTRFEVDLNRPPEEAVYRTPDAAWGLNVWRGMVPESVVARSMAIYEAFYAAVDAVLRGKIRTYGAAVVYDLHTYNHRRAGPDAPPADPEANPDVNVGTGSLDRSRWGPLVERFMADLREGGHRAGLGALDVRENVKFQGGYFPQRLHEHFGPNVCVLAIEFKKTFMDEWTGALNRVHFARLREALAHTFPGVSVVFRHLIRKLAIRVFPTSRR
jgi:hypothetical protein